MNRLNEKQLHIITGLIVCISVVLFFVFSMPDVKQTESIQLDSLEDFSDGWLCIYYTTNTDVLKKYYSESEILEGKNKVEEIFQLPFDLEIEKGKKIELTNRLPKMSDQSSYLVLETDAQNLAVYVGKDCLYRSTELDDRGLATHFVKIPYNYQDEIVRVIIQKEESKQLHVNPILFGNNGQIVIWSLKQNGFHFVCSIVLGVLALCMLVVLRMIKASKERKKLLKYVELEGFTIAGLLFIESRLFQVLTGWNYSLHVLQACVTLILIFFHLLIIRYVMKSKKVCLFVDMGIAAMGIVYISVMVLQAFSLISFETIYLIGKILFFVVISIYTILMLMTSSKKGTPDLWWIMTGNIVLILSVIVRLIMPYLGNSNQREMVIPVAFLIYAAIAYYRGMKKATFEKAVSQQEQQMEDMRLQIVEQINPNLLFASLHTLQKMIKSNSDNSIKMLYYMSVYFRGNLLALEKQDDIISFEMELEHIIAYLQLQKSRNQDLKYAIECKEKNFLIPRNSIEPMIENAVKYGVGGNNNQGNVVIRSYQRSDGYAVQIIDDGAGFDVNGLKKTSKTSLLNLFDTLKANCGANIEVVSKEGKGTVITLVLPMLENDLLQDKKDGGKNG